MQIKLLKEIVVGIAGPNSEKLVDALYGKKKVNEFLIAKKLGVSINQTRNVLYRLSDEGLVSFIRKKDKKNGGWYTYFWTLDVKKSLLNLRLVLYREIKRLEEQHRSRKDKRFYFCKECGLEMAEDNALLHNFTCPECGEILVLRDGGEIVSNLEGKLAKLRQSLEEVEGEIEEVSKKNEIARRRKLNVIKKKKLEERAARRIARAKERAKEAKKLGKKVKVMGKRKTTGKKVKKITGKKKTIGKKVKKVVSKKKSTGKKVKKVAGKKKAIGKKVKKVAGKKKAIGKKVKKVAGKKKAGSKKVKGGKKEGTIVGKKKNRGKKVVMKKKLKGKVQKRK